MFSFARISENLAAAWDVMNGRTAGLARFDLSVEGFWSSFGAIVLILPIAIMSVYSQQIALVAEDAAAGHVTFGLLIARLLALVVDWLAFPLLFAWLARPLGLAGQYAPFIIARNWAAVIISAGFGILDLAHLIGILPSTMWLIALFALFLVALRFAYMIARTVLMVPVGLAIPIVLLEPLLSILIDISFDRIVG